MLVLRPTYLIRSSVPLDWWARNLAGSILLQICINILTPLIHISFSHWFVREVPNLFSLLKVILFLLLSSLTLSGAFCIISSSFSALIMLDILNFSSANSIYSRLLFFFFVVMLLMKLLSHQSWDRSLRNSKNILYSPTVPLCAQAIVISLLVSSFSALLDSASHFGSALSLVAAIGTYHSQSVMRAAGFWGTPICIWYFLASPR